MGNVLIASVEIHGHRVRDGCPIPVLRGGVPMIAARVKLSDHREPTLCCRKGWGTRHTTQEIKRV